MATASNDEMLESIRAGAPSDAFTEGELEAKKVLVSRHPTNQALMPEDCVAAVLFLCSDGAFYTVGQPLFIDGGYSAQ